MCKVHSELVGLYCQQHDKIGCSNCIALNHKSCKKVFYIPNSAEELLQQRDIKKLNSQLTATIEGLEAIETQQKATLVDLDDDRKCCLEAIDAHHEQLHALLNNLVKSKQQVNHRYDTMKVDLHRHLQNVETCLADLKAAQDRLSKCNDNAAQQFIEMKKCQGTLKSTEHITTNAIENMLLKGVDVSIDTRLEELLTDLETLVTMVEPLRVKSKHKVDISVEEDENMCVNYGTCVLGDGSVLLADYNNKRLKRLDSDSLSITDYCLMEERPSDVCCINDTEAVVAHGESLVFVSLQPRLAPTRTLTLDHWCSYVAYSENKLFVTDLKKKCLYVYNMSGDLLRTVTTDESGHNIFSKSRHVAVSEDGKKVYIADEDKGLITLDKYGRVLRTLTRSDVSCAHGVCTDGYGGMFLCGNSSANVVHVGQRGKVLSETVSESDVLVDPSSVSYDRMSKRLFVSQESNNYLLVFDLE